MATIYRRGETWWIYSCSGGRRLRWSLETDDERIARRKLRKFEYEQDTGNLDVPSSTPIDSFLQAFCEHLQTLRGRKSYKNDVSYLRTTFGPICPVLEPGSTVNHRFTSTKPIAVKDQLAGRHVRVGTLEELTPATIEEFIARRIKRDGISAKTANRHREVLHVMFNYAIRHHGFRALDQRYPNPADAVARRREAEQPIRHLSLEEIDTQIKMLADHPVIRTMVAVYIYAGLRREEALWLTPNDVDLEQGMIHVRQKTIDGQQWQPKTGRNRRVPISSSLRRYLEAFDLPAGATWYFTTPKGKHWDPDNFSQRLRKINEANGLPWGCLDFRHTFGSQLAQKGESLYKISELMGNSPDICRRHYAALTPERMRDAVEFDQRPTPPPLKLRAAESA
jgi:integrase